MKVFLKKVLIVLLCSFVFGTVGTSIAFAESDSELGVTDEVQQKLDNLYNYINNIQTDAEISNGLDPASYVKSYIESGKGNLSLGTILSAGVSLVFREVGAVLTLACTIFIIGVISALLKSLQETFTSEGISEMAFYACFVLIVMILSKTFLISLNSAKNVIMGVSEFMNVLLPVLVIMLGAAGGFTQAATMDPIILGATIFVPKLYINIVLPLIMMCFVVQFANNISKGTKVSNLASMLKKSITWIQGVIITIFIGILTVRGITASTIDAVTLKTTKYAVDNFIPIVGKSFSDAITSVAGYSLIIKNAIGSIGLIVIILIIMYPIVKIILSSIILKITAALLEPIADKRLTTVIVAASEALTFIMSSVLFISLMFFILIAIMSQAGKFVIGG